MKALVLEAANQPLQYQDVPDPVAGPGEVVMQIEAASLNHRDNWIQKGQYAGLKFPIILGSDGCGTVASCGEGVDLAWQGRQVIINPGLEWGDRPAAQCGNFRILGLPDDGTFAERVRVPFRRFGRQAGKSRRPARRRAAARGSHRLPRSFQAGQPAKRRAGPYQRRGWRGWHSSPSSSRWRQEPKVYVTSGNDAKIQQAVGLGAVGGANYKSPDFAAGLKALAGGLFDVIVDSAGGEGFGKLIDSAAPGGRIVFFGATRGNPPGFDMRKVFWKQLSILGSTMGSPDDFAEMIAFVDRHRIVPVADLAFPLAQGNEALKAMDSAEQFGKIILTM